jgi:hypothetical protein
VISTYDDIAARLTHETEDMFREMVDAHLRASGDPLFIRADSSSGNALIMTGRGNPSWSGFDGGVLDDLVGFSLLRENYNTQGSSTYRVTANGLHFHGWLMQRRGATVAQVEHEATELLSGDAYAASHPDAAHHLAEAFALLWSGQTDSQTVSEIGGHLRSALMDATTVAVGDDGGEQEKPIERLQRWTEERLEGNNLPEREAEVVRRLTALADAVLRLDQRLDHVRDESDKGSPSVEWEETRRAAFVTTFVCYELDRLR